MSFEKCNRVVSIHQPNYLPWLGFISKIACSDVYIILDNVKYNKRTFHHRSRYSSDAGLKWLSLSVQSKGTWEGGTLINQVKMASDQATPRHFKTLWHRYGKSPGWRLIADRLEAVLNREYEYMIDASIATIMLTLDVFRVRPDIKLASSINAAGTKGDLMLNLTKAVKGDFYLSGSGARDYLDQKEFLNMKIGVSFQDFAHPSWVQRTNLPFQESAFALEWYLEEPETSVQDFHKHMYAQKKQYPRCLK